MRDTAGVHESDAGLAAGLATGLAAGLAAVLVAGGSAARLGGRDKPAIAVRGVSLLDRVLAAVEVARPRVVVGPPRTGLPADVVSVQEEPPGGGPVAAAAAGLTVISTRRVALLASDLPWLTAAAVAALDAALADSTMDGALFVDSTGRRQLLCGVWRTAALKRRLAELAGPDEPAGPTGPTGPAGRLAGLPVRVLLAGLAVVEVGWPAGTGEPWFDCDTEADLRRAEETAWPVDRVWPGERGGDHDR